MGQKTVQFVWFVMCWKTIPKMWSFILSFVHHSLIGKGNEKVLQKYLNDQNSYWKSFRSLLVVYLTWDRWGVCYSWFLCITYALQVQPHWRKDTYAGQKHAKFELALVFGEIVYVGLCVIKKWMGTRALCTTKIVWQRQHSDAADSLQLEKCHHSRKTTQEKDYIFKCT